MQQNGKVEWSQQMLEDLITNNAEENVHLDFKSGQVLTLPINDEKKKDICKDVSAFANSDGGVLVYGITEVDHKAYSFSFVDGDAFTKERLEQIINDGIQRRLDEIVITPVRVDGDIKRTVYVVEIPVSSLAPHMIKDNKYYKRFNFRSVAMEEYEVRHTFERKQNSKLVFGEILSEFTNSDSWFEDQSYDFDLLINIENIGHAIAENYKLVVQIKSEGGITYTYQNHHNYIFTKQSDGADTISTSSSFPIYPGEHINVMEIQVMIPVGYRDEELLESFQIQINLFQLGGNVELVIKPGKLLHDKIMMHINPEFYKEMEMKRAQDEFSQNDDAS